MNGVKHIANMSNPQIPSALAPAVIGVVSLNDFRAHTQYTPANGYFPIVPADLATIFNLAPLFVAGYSGQGQTIAVVGRSDLFDTNDWNTFRTTFGLSSAYPDGSLVQVNPPSSGTNDCNDPGSVVTRIDQPAENDVGHDDLVSNFQWLGRAPSRLMQK